MFFGLFSVFSVLILIVAILASAKLLKPFSWIMGWLKGTLGMCFLLLAALIVAVNVDLMSYKRLASEKPIATLSFEKVGEQRFKGTLVVIEDNVEETFDVHGDQWQMDARIIRWKGVFQAFGVKPGYRLDRLSGRYFSLEDERRKERSVHRLSSSQYVVDLWQWLHGKNNFFPWIEAVYGSATFLPMSDGAVYQVSLGHSGLTAKPLNSAATDAINQFL